MASASGTQKPSWSDARTKTSAARKYASSSAPLTDPARLTASLSPSSSMKAPQRRLVGLTERRAHQVEARRRVVDAAQDVEHLDQVVRGLVRRDLPHVEQVGPALALLAARQGGRQLRVGLVALDVHVDQQRDDGGPLVAERLQLGLVEGGVRHGEAALRRQTGELRAPQRRLVGHRGLPVAQQCRRRDVVVVDELGLGARGEDVVDRAPDRRLIQQPPVAPRTPELDDGPPLVRARRAWSSRRRRRSRCPRRATRRAGSVC